jgi:hypothetical protein
VKPGDPVMFTDWGGPPLPGRVRRVEPAGFTKVSALGIEEQRVNIVMDLNDPAARQNLGHGYRFVANIAVWEGGKPFGCPNVGLVSRRRWLGGLCGCQQPGRMAKRLGRSHQPDICRNS